MTLIATPPLQSVYRPGDWLVSFETAAPPEVYLLVSSLFTHPRRFLLSLARRLSPSLIM